MSKRYKGRTCVYCLTEAASSTGDHVFAREFVPIARRANLPKVPACSDCNGAKSHHEHYLMTVLPFGGQHADAKEILAQDVPRRLERNQKLQQSMSNSFDREVVTGSGVVGSRTTVDFEPDELLALVRYMVRGFAFHHWGILIPATHHVEAIFVTRFGEAALAPLMAMNGTRVRESLGGDALTYEGLQAVEEPTLTIWQFDIYGGAAFCEGGGGIDHLSSRIVAVSSTKPLLHLLE